MVTQRRRLGLVLALMLVLMLTLALALVLAPVLAVPVPVLMHQQLHYRKRAEMPVAWHPLTPPVLPMLVSQPQQRQTLPTRPHCEPPVRQAAWLQATVRVPKNHQTHPSHLQPR